MRDGILHTDPIDYPCNKCGKSRVWGQGGTFYLDKDEWPEQITKCHNCGDTGTMEENEHYIKHTNK